MSEIELEIDKGKGVRGMSDSGPLIAHELKATVRDIADKIQEAAIAFAPRGKTGELKAHPVDRNDAIGVVEGNAFSFGGGVSARGAGGRFVAGGVPEEQTGHTVATVDFTIPKVPRHAIFVHNGTRTPITARKPGGHLVFLTNRGKLFVGKAVRGQAANPYLTKAYELVDRTWVPIEVEKLRAKIDALTK